MSASSFAHRLAHASAVSGLSPAQLGVARVYERPHRLSSPTPPASPLDGTEILIKDLQQVEGEVASFGSSTQEFTAMYHDTAAQRLLGAGAVLVGASSTSEFGVTAYTEPVGMEEPINPLGQQWMCGGSSGGAAVAVARGLVDVAHATDGGGSIRIPAACCGIPGLKPRHDRTLGGFTPTAHGLLAGDLTSTASAYGLQIPDVADAVRSGQRPALRVGYTNAPLHIEGTTLSPAIAATTSAAAALLCSTDAVDSLSQPPNPYGTHSGAEVFDWFAEILAARCADLPGALTPITRWLKETGRTVTRDRREELQSLLRSLAGTVEASWADYDVILTPTIACAPPAPGTFSEMSPEKNFRAQTAWTPWGTLWNITGWASLSVPLVSPRRLAPQAAARSTAANPIPTSATFANATPADATPASATPAVGTPVDSPAQGRWPISLMIGAVSDRVSEAELLALGAIVQQQCEQFGVDQLSIAEPGTMAEIDFPPKPRGHTHSDEHGPGHEH